MMNLHDYIESTKNTLRVVSFSGGRSRRCLVLSVAIIRVVLSAVHRTACHVVAFATTEFSRLGCIHLEFIAAPFALFHGRLSGMSSGCFSATDDSGALRGTKLHAGPSCFCFPTLELLPAMGACQRDILHFPVLGLVRSPIFPVALYRAKQSSGVAGVVEFAVAVLALFEHDSPGMHDNGYYHAFYHKMHGDAIHGVLA